MLSSSFFINIPHIMKKILVVCLGNICRSPLAEGILQHQLGNNFIVESAGTIDMHKGKQPDHRSIHVAQQHGIDISKQKSRPFVVSDFDEFDMIYCMDEENLKDVHAISDTAEQRKKVKLFLEVLNDPAKTEVPDPYWGGAEDFEKIFQLIESASILIAKDLKS